MSHFEERLERDLEKIRGEVAAVAEKVETAVRHARDALLTHNKPLANETILGDLPINRAIRNIDRLCYRFIALYLPSAGHLRYISTVLRLDIALERIGDYAVTICREVNQLRRPPTGIMRREIERLADEALEIYRQAMRAFNERNADLARATIPLAAQARRSFGVAYADLVEEGKRHAYECDELLMILIILNRISRINDQAKNICEDTVFAVTGESKQPKVYRIAFLEDEDRFLGPMAVAVARKTYPNSGRYTSAGLHPAPALEPDFVAWMEAHGYDVTEARPRPIDWPPEDWETFHVVISLDGPVERYLDPPPFNTAVLEWRIDLEGAATPEERFERALRQIAAHVSALMETMRGEDAD